MGIMLFFYLYLLLGAIYTIYITFWGRAKWYLFPINVLGGPIVFIVIVYKALTNQRFRF